ncbi:MAG: restriction endonuclease subunit S, partial [Lactobacillus iners]|nr:restriction endonuclease subunit S [Lactobacillus iners]
LEIIDDKIELNNKINKNLEQQAQAIFKAWFIDFEPFDEKIPANWVVSKLGDIASIKTNSFSPVKNPDAQLEHYSIPAYDEQKYPVFESAEGVKSNKYILSKNSVMISKLNPDTKRAWRPMCLSDLAVSSTEFIIFEAFNPAYKDFVFSIIDSAAFSDWMCTHTTGSTNSRQRTTPSATLEFQIALPDEKTITDFCAIVTPMYDTISANICENQKLAQLRDYILPKLMSGELDVSNIDL